MKKTLTALVALALVLTVLCSQALASVGDITVKSVKAYADAAMTQLVGSIPAYTALKVRSYDSYADVTLGGRTVYIDTDALLSKDIVARYTATLKKGTKVYQRATTAAANCKLKSGRKVKVLKVKGDWALVQTTNSFGAYGFVKVEKLTGIKAN